MADADPIPDRFSDLRDKDTVSRYPATYQEAVEFEAAKARLKGREPADVANEAPAPTDVPKD